MASDEVVLHLTRAEAGALFGMVVAGEQEWLDVVDQDPDASPQKKTATHAAGRRAKQKLRDA
jgi:hypothetical protein